MKILVLGGEGSMVEVIDKRDIKTNETIEKLHAYFSWLTCRK